MVDGNSKKMTLLMPMEDDQHVAQCEKQMDRFTRMPYEVRVFIVHLSF